MKNEFTGSRAMLEEVKIAYDEQLNNVSVSKSTAQAMLASASLILAIIGAFSSSSLPLDGVNFAGALSLFLALLFIAIYTLVPVTLTTPIKMTQENLENYYKWSGAELEEKLIKQYLMAMEKNKAPIKWRVYASIATGFLLAGIVAALLLPLI